MAKIIDLPADLVAGSVFVTGKLANIKIDNVAVDPSLITITGNGKIMTIAGLGTFTVGSTDTTFTFKAASDAKAGEYQIATTTKAEKLDFSAVSGDISVGSANTGGATTLIGGAGNDNLALSVAGALNGSAGDDVLAANADGVTLTGGAGADTFSIKGANDIVKDYDYSQGDLVSLGAARTDIVLDKAGQLATDKFSVTSAAADNVYKVKVQNGTAAEQYWTAKTADTVTLDASAVTDNMFINAEAATTVAVQGGTGADKISIKGAKAAVTVNSKSGGDSVYGFDTGFDGDVINLSGVALKDLKFKDTEKTISLDGSTKNFVSLDGAGVEGGYAEINFKVDGGDTKKVAIANAAGNATIKSAAADADVYLGDNTTEVDFSGYKKDGFVVDLTDTAKFININSIKGAAAGGIYMGTAGNEEFDLSAATKASEVWAGNGTNKIVLEAANEVQDTVWFGTADGANTSL